MDRRILGLLVMLVGGGGGAWLASSGAPVEWLVAAFALYAVGATTALVSSKKKEA